MDLVFPVDLLRLLGVLVGVSGVTLRSLHTLGALWSGGARSAGWSGGPGVPLRACRSRSALGALWSSEWYINPVGAIPYLEVAGNDVGVLWGCWGSRQF